MNAQCINAKFAELHVLIDDLNAEHCTFGAICIQETWLNDNDDASMYNIPGYNMIHQGKICCGHGGLIIYLNDKYTHTVRKDLCKDSTVWEGLFIDISAETVSKKITLGNIYKPQTTTTTIQILQHLSMNFFLCYIHQATKIAIQFWQVILIWIY